MNKLQKEGSDGQIESLFTDHYVLTMVANFKKINDDIASINNGFGVFYNTLTVSGSGSTFTSLGQFYNNRKTENTDAALKDIIQALYSALLQIDGLVNTYPPAVPPAVKEVVTTNLTNVDLKNS